MIDGNKVVVGFADAAQFYSVSHMTPDTGSEAKVTLANMIWCWQLYWAALNAVETDQSSTKLRTNCFP